MHAFLFSAALAMAAQGDASASGTVPDGLRDEPPSQSWDDRDRDDDGDAQPLPMEPFDPAESGEPPTPVSPPPPPPQQTPPDPAPPHARPGKTKGAPFQWQHDFQFGVVGKYGAGLSHAYTAAAPVVPTPGLGLRLRYEVRFLPDWRFVATGSGAGGGSDDGTYNPFGGYGLRLSLGHRWMRNRWFSWWSEVHKGVESLFFIPVPYIGVGNTFTLIPVATRLFYWDVSLSTDLDALVIVPAVTGQLSTLAVFTFAGWILGVEVLGVATGKVAIIANSVAGSVQGRFVFGYRF